jgi:hypothetical protein
MKDISFVVKVSAATETYNEERSLAKHDAHPKGREVLGSMKDISGIAVSEQVCIGFVYHVPRNSW